MEPTKEIRIDKFLWAVRIYKTRTIAAEACSKGHIVINNVPVKPSRIVKEGETIIVRKPPFVNTYLVRKVLENRQSAQKVLEYIEEITPTEELLKRDIIKFQRNAVRDRGTGRPTKRDRRDIDKFTGTV